MIDIHFVPHTHWDREWYLPFQAFRIRLVRLVDRLMDILERDPDYVSFHLDGQSSVLDDYLDVRPDRRERLAGYIREGRIKVGPWYVQPDESLVSGESLIRNFRLGIRVAEALGGSQRFGYLPDMFGHISQLPQILAGFGMKEAVFWRGLGDTVNRSHTELRWQGADGTEMLAYRFPNAIGYNSVFRLHADPALAERQLRELLDVHLLPATQASSVLVMVGVDHMEPQANLSEVLRGLAPRFPEFRLLHSTMERFLAAAFGEIAASGAEMHVARGEQRDTNRSPDGKINFLLANVLSSRMPLKQKNAQVQYELERWAEPFSAAAAAAGSGADVGYPEELLERSWKYLLQNHPHDSICGCSVDEVHRQMATRFEWADEIARQLSDEALRAIAADIDTSGLPDDRLLFHVFNPLEHPRSDTVTVKLLLPDAEPNLRAFVIRDTVGRALPSQWVDVQRVLRAANHPETAIRDLGMLQDAPPPEENGILVGFEYVREATVRFAPGELPPLGYATFTAEPVRRTAPDAGSLIDGRKLENEWLRIEVADDGSIAMTEKTTGRRYDRLLTFEDDGDIGDGYTYSPPLFDRRFTTAGSPASVSTAEDGPAKGMLRVEREWLLPEGLEQDRKHRSEVQRVCRLVTEISLGREDRWAGVTIRFDNNARDHRLRVKLPTGIASGESWASSAFDLVRRSTAVTQPDPEIWIEDAVGVHPNHGLAGVTDGAGLHSFAVAPYGLPEYELRPDGELSVTLLRAVGHLGSPDVRTISGGAGPAFETPEGQCQGAHVFNLALIPFAGTPETAEAWRRAAEHHLPARAVQMRRHAGTLPLAHSFIRLEEATGPVLLSAFRSDRKSGNLFVRVYNPSSKAHSVALVPAVAATEAYATDLEDNRLYALATEANGTRIPLTVGAKKIVTVELGRV